MRLERTFQAYFQRLKHGEQPGLSSLPGAQPLPQFALSPIQQRVVLEAGILSLSKIGRIPIRVHRPLFGAPKTVIIAREVDG